MKMPLAYSIVPIAPSATTIFDCSLERNSAARDRVVGSTEVMEEPCEIPQLYRADGGSRRPLGRRLELGRRCGRFWRLPGSRSFRDRRREGPVARRQNFGESRGCGAGQSVLRTLRQVAGNW